MKHLVAAALLASLSLAGCGPDVRGDGDAGPNDPCSGDETRCLENAVQECQDGRFVSVEACSGVCVIRGGDAACAECDPANGLACDGQDVVTCNADGTYGAVQTTCGGGEACVGGACSRSCTADGVDLIYVVDETYRLLSFNPRNLGTAVDPFTLIGQLSCQTTMGDVPGWVGAGGPPTPFSMSVDRTGSAWVLYTSGEVFKVSTQDASCQPTGYLARQANMLLFGMGFVSDAAGSDAEHLFIGGGNPDATAGGGRLGSVDPASYGLAMLGNITAVSELSPELTGTGNGELFGFFPGLSRAFVQQIDKTSGAPVGAEQQIPGGLGGNVQAWAFAQWGGKFYIFVTTTDGLTSNSTVRTIDRMTGAAQTVLQNLPYIIVGAGVSTCAPVEIQ